MIPEPEVSTSGIDTVIQQVFNTSGVPESQLASLQLLHNYLLKGPEAACCPKTGHAELLDALKQLQQLTSTAPAALDQHLPAPPAAGQQHFIPSAGLVPASALVTVLGHLRPSTPSTNSATLTTSTGPALQALSTPVPIPIPASSAITTVDTQQDAAQQQLVARLATDHALLPRCIQLASRSLQQLSASQASLDVVDTWESHFSSQSDPWQSVITPEEQLALVSVCLALLHDATWLLHKFGDTSVLQSEAVMSCVPEFTHSMSQVMHVLMQPYPEQASQVKKAAWAKQFATTQQQEDSTGRAQPPPVLTPAAAAWGALTRLIAKPEEVDSVQGQLVAAVWSDACGSTARTSSVGLAKLPALNLPEIKHMSALHVWHLVIITGSSDQLVSKSIQAQLSRFMPAPSVSPVSHLLDITTACLSPPAGSSSSPRASRPAEAAAADVSSQTSLPLIFKDIFETDITDTTDVLVRPGAEPTLAPWAKELQEAVSARLLHTWADLLGSSGTLPAGSWWAPADAAGITSLVSTCCTAYAAAPAHVQAAMQAFLAALCFALYEHMDHVMHVALLDGLSQAISGTQQASSSKLQLLQALAAHAAIACASTSGVESGKEQLTAMWLKVLSSDTLAVSGAAASSQPSHMVPLLLVTAAAPQDARAYVLGLCLRQLALISDKVHQLGLGQPAADQPSSSAPTHAQVADALARTTRCCAIACMLGALDQGCPAWVLHALNQALQAGPAWLAPHSQAAGLPTGLPANDTSALSTKYAAATPRLQAVEGVLWAVLQHVCQGTEEEAGAPGASCATSKLWQAAMLPEMLQSVQAADCTADAVQVQADSIVASVQQLCTKQLTACWSHIRLNDSLSQAAADEARQLVRLSALAASALLQQSGLAVSGAAFNQCDSLSWQTGPASVLDAHSTPSSVQSLLHLSATDPSAPVVQSLSDGAADQVLAWWSGLVQQLQLQKYSSRSDFSSRSFALLNTSSEMLLHLVRACKASSRPPSLVKELIGHVFSFYMAAHEQLVVHLLTDMATAKASSSSPAAGVLQVSSKGEPAVLPVSPSDVLGTALAKLIDVPLDRSQLSECLNVASGMTAEVTSQALSVLFSLGDRQQLYSSTQQALARLAQGSQVDAPDTVDVKPSALLLWLHHTAPSVTRPLSASLHSCQRVLRVLLLVMHELDSTAARQAVEPFNSHSWLYELSLPQHIDEQLPATVLPCDLTRCSACLEWCIETLDQAPPPPPPASGPGHAPQPPSAQHVACSMLAAGCSFALHNCVQSGKLQAEPLPSVARQVVRLASSNVAPSYLVQLLLSEKEAVEGSNALIPWVVQLLTTHAEGDEKLADERLQRLLVNTCLAVNLGPATITTGVSMWKRLVDADFKSKADSGTLDAVSAQPGLAVRLCAALMHLITLDTGTYCVLNSTGPQLLLHMLLGSLGQHAAHGSHALLQSVTLLGHVVSKGDTGGVPGVLEPRHARATRFFLPLVELLTGAVQETSKALQTLPDHQQEQRQQLGVGRSESRSESQDAASHSSSSTQAWAAAEQQEGGTSTYAATSQLSTASAATQVQDEQGHHDDGGVAPMDVDHDDEDEDDDEYHDDYHDDDDDDDDDEDEADEHEEEGEEGVQLIEGQPHDDDDDEDDEDYDEDEEEYEEDEEEDDDDDDDDDEGREGQPRAGGGAADAIRAMTLPAHLLNTLLDRPGGARRRGGEGLQGHPLGALLNWELLMDEPGGGAAQGENLRAWELAVLEELQRVGGALETILPPPAPAPAAAPAAGVSLPEDLDDQSSDDGNSGGDAHTVGRSYSRRAGSGSRHRRDGMGNQAADLAGAADASRRSRLRSTAGLADALSDDERSKSDASPEGSWTDAGAESSDSQERAADRPREPRDREPVMGRCSYGDSGQSFVEQHWYYCYTCGLFDSKGCCTTCARVCHKGHDLVYAAYSRFFCDCGAGEGVPRAVTCRCLEPQPLPPTSSNTRKQSRQDNSHWLSQGMMGAADACWPMGDPLRLAWRYPAPSSSAQQAKHVGPALPHLVHLLNACSGSTTTSSSSERLAANRAAQQLVSAAASGLTSLLSSSGPKATAHVALAHACGALVHISSMQVATASQAPAKGRRLDGSLNAADQTLPIPAKCALVVKARASHEAASSAAPATSSAAPATSSGDTKPSDPSKKTYSTQGSDLVRLQCVLRLGNLDNRPGAQSRGGSRMGGRGTRGGAGGDGDASHLPQEQAEAVENGVAVMNTVSLSQATGLLALARGSFIGVLDAQQHILQSEMLFPASGRASGGQPGSSLPTSSPSAQKNSISLLHRHSVRFPVLSVAFDPLMGRHLAVVGLHQLQVWTVSKTGQVLDRLPVTLPHADTVQTPGTTEGGAEMPGTPGRAAPGALGQIISRAAWLPGHDTWLLITTPMAVYVYDVSRSASKPVWSIVVGGSHSAGPSSPEPGSSSPAPGLRAIGDLIASAAVVTLPPAPLTPAEAETATNSSMHVLILSRDGGLFRCCLPRVDSAPWGPLTAQPIQLSVQPVQGLDQHLHTFPGPVSGCGLQVCDAAGKLVISLAGVTGSETAAVTLLARYQPASCSLAEVQTLHVELPHQPATTSSTSSSSEQAVEAGQPEQQAMVPQQRQLYGNSPQAGVMEICMQPAARAQAGAASMLVLTLKPPANADTHEEQRASSKDDDGKLPPVAIFTYLPDSSTGHVGSTPDKLFSQALSLPASTSVADARLEGTSCMSCPATHQTLVVMACSKGNLYFIITTQLEEVPLLEPAASELLCMLSSDEPAKATDSSDVSTSHRSLLTSTTASYASAAIDINLPPASCPVTSHFSKVWARMAARRSTAADPSWLLSQVSAAATAAKLQQQQASAAAARSDDAAAYESMPSLLIEKAQEVSNQVTYGGDIDHMGGTEGVRRMACNASNMENFLEAPSRSAMKLIIKNKDPALVIVAVKVLVGVSVDKYVPASLRLGGTHTGATAAPKGGTGSRRWYQLMMSAADALAAHPEPVLTIGATADGASRARVHLLQVFALPVELVKSHVKVVAEVPPALPLSTCSLAVGAVCNPFLFPLPVKDSASAPESGPLLGLAGAATANQPPSGVGHMLRAVYSSLKLCISQGVPVAASQLQQAQALALAVLAPPLDVTGGVWVETADQSVARQLLMLCQSPAAQQGPASSQDSSVSSSHAEGSAAETSAPQVATGEVQWLWQSQLLNNALEVFARVAPAMGLPAALLSNSSSTARANTVWQDAHSWVTLQAAAAVLHVGSTSPHNLVRWLQQACQKHWEPSSTAPHPILLVLGVLYGTQLAGFSLKTRVSSSFLPTSLTYPLSLACSYCLIATHVASMSTPKLLQVQSLTACPPLPPVTGASTMGHATSLRSDVSLADLPARSDSDATCSPHVPGSEQHVTHPATLPFPLPVGSDTASAVQTHLPPAVRVPSFPSVEDMQQGHLRPPELAFGAIAAAARSSSVSSAAGGRAPSPAPIPAPPAPAAGRVSAFSASQPPGPCWTIEPGQLLMSALQAEGSTGWISANLPKQLPHLLTSQWFHDVMSVSGAASEQAKQAVSSLVSSLAAAIASQVDPGTQASGGQAGAGHRTGSSALGGIAMISTCQTLLHCCSSTRPAPAQPEAQTQLAQASSSNWQPPPPPPPRPGTSSPAVAAPTSTSPPDVEPVLQQLSSACIPQLQALNAEVAQMCCEDAAYQPFPGAPPDPHALHSLVPCAPYPTLPVRALFNVSSPRLQQLAVALHTLYFTACGTTRSQEAQRLTSSTSPIPTAVASTLKTQLLKLLSLLLPPILTQHRLAMLHAVFYAGPSNRKAQATGSSSSSTSATSTTASAAPAATTGTSTSRRDTDVAGAAVRSQQAGWGGYMGFQALVPPQMSYLTQTYGSKASPDWKPFLSDRLLPELHQGKPVLKQTIAGVVAATPMLLVQAAVVCLTMLAGVPVEEVQPVAAAASDKVGGTPADTTSQQAVMPSVLTINTQQVGTPRVTRPRVYSPRGAAVSPRGVAVSPRLRSHPLVGVISSPDTVSSQVVWQRGDVEQATGSVDIKHVLTLLSQAKECRALSGTRQQVQQLLDGLVKEEPAAGQLQHVAHMTAHAEMLLRVTRKLEGDPYCWAWQCVRDRTLDILQAASCDSPHAWQQVVVKTPGILLTLLKQAVTLACQCKTSALHAVELMHVAIKAGAAAGASTLDLSILGLPVDESLDDAAQQHALMRTPLMMFAHTTLLQSADSYLRKASQAFMQALWKRYQQTSATIAQQQLLSCLVHTLRDTAPDCEAARQLVKLIDAFVTSSAPPTPAPAKGTSTSGLASKRSRSNATDPVHAADTAGQTAGSWTPVAARAAHAARSVSSPAPGTSPQQPSTAPVHPDPPAHPGPVIVTPAHVHSMCSVLCSCLDHVHASQAVHPLGTLYPELRDLVEVGGKYLEVDCLTPLKPRHIEKEFKLNKLESIKQSLRYTAHSVMAHLSAPQSIKALSLTFTDTRKSHCIAAIKVSYYDGLSPDLAHLKSPAGAHLWKQLALMHLAPCQPDCGLTLESPITATAVCFEVVSRYSSLHDASLETLTCPRCSSAVTDKFGVCGYCGENAHQCRQCRSINYAQLDGFLCADCGHSRYCRIDLQLMSAPAWQLPHLTTDEEVAVTQQQVVTVSDDVSRKLSALAGLTRALSAAVSSDVRSGGPAGKAGKGADGSALAALLSHAGEDASRSGVEGSSKQPASATTVITNVYNSRCKSLHQEAVQLCRKLAGLRMALLAAGSPAQLDPLPTVPTSLLSASLPGPTYPATQELQQQLLSLLLLLVKTHPISHAQLLSAGLVGQLFEHDLTHNNPSVRSMAMQIILHLTQLTPVQSAVSTSSPRASESTGRTQSAGLTSRLSREAPLPGGSSAETAQQASTSGKAGSAAVAASAQAGSKQPGGQDGVQGTANLGQPQSGRMPEEAAAAAQAQLVSLLAGPLMQAVQNPGRFQDGQYIRALVDLLVQAARAEVQAVPSALSLTSTSQEPADTGSPAKSGLGSAAPQFPSTSQVPVGCGMLELVLRILHTCRAQTGGSSTAPPSHWLVTGTLPSPGSPEAGPTGLGDTGPQAAVGTQGSCSPHVSEHIVQPLLKLLASLLRDKKRQFLVLFGSVVLRAQLCGWSAAAAARASAPPAVGSQPDTSAAAEVGADTRPGKPDIRVKPGLEGPLDKSGKRAKTYAIFPGLDTQGPPGVTKTPPGAQATAPAGAGQRSGSATQPSSYANKTAAALPKLQMSKWQKPHGMSSSPADTPRSAGSGPPTTGATAPSAYAPKPTLESCLPVVPDAVIGVIGTFMLDPYLSGTRQQAVQLFQALHTEKLALQSAARGLNSSPLVKKTSIQAHAGTAASDTSSAPAASRLQALAHARAAASSSSDTADKAGAPLLQMLEALLEWLPPTCAAGLAGEEVWRLMVQDCVPVAASQTAYSLLSRLLTSIMTLLPQLVSNLLVWEHPHTSQLTDNLGTSSSSDGSSTGRAAASVTLPPAGAAFCVQQLSGLLAKLLEYSELQGHLLTDPAGLLPVKGLVQPVNQPALLVWSYTGLQAIRLQASKHTKQAETALHELLVARFLKAGDEMRRTLIRSCCAALAMLTTITATSLTGTVPATATTGNRAAVEVGAGVGVARLIPDVQQRMQRAVLQLMLKVIVPPKDDAAAAGPLLILEKSATQEEFIPGSMGSAPYKSCDIPGPLMRDVKDFICRRLDLDALVEDDFGMELLVAGNIVHLGLNIQDVYNQVWKPYMSSGASRLSRYASILSAGGPGGAPHPPMVVTYRLSGLDGEAVEPVVKELTCSAGQQQADPEREFAVAGVLSDSDESGLPLLLSMMRADVAPASSSTTSSHPDTPPTTPATSQPTRLLLLKLLQTVSQLRKCRSHLAELGAVTLLVAHVHTCMRSLLSQTGGAADVAGGWGDVAVAQHEVISIDKLLEELQLLLGLLEVAAAEVAAAPTTASWRKPTRASSPDSQDSAAQVRHLADGLHALSMIPGAQEAAAVLARVLPLLAHGNYQAQLGLLDHFQPSLDMAHLDTASFADQEEMQAQITSFTELLTSLTAAPQPGGQQAAPSSTSTTAGSSAEGGVGAASAGASSFRELLLQRQVPTALATYLLASFRRDPSLISGDVPYSGSLSSLRRTTVHDRAGPASPMHSQPIRSVLASSPGVFPSMSPGAGGSTVDAQGGLVSPGSTSLAPGGTRGGPGSSRADAGSTVQMGDELSEWCIPAGNAAWKAVLARPGVSSALKLLVSMCQGHVDTVNQVCGVLLPEWVEQEPAHHPAAGTSEAPSVSAAAQRPSMPLLPLLHCLEGVAGGAEVAPLAESLLDTLAGTAGQGSSISAGVTELREASKRRAKELAARRRQAMLSNIGVSPLRIGVDGGGTPPGTTPTNPLSPYSGGSAWSTPYAATPAAQTAPAGISTAPGVGDAAASGQVQSQTGFQPTTSGTGAAGAEAGGSGSRTSLSGAAPPLVGSPHLASVMNLAGSQLAMELAALEAEEESSAQEEHLRCMVCREGYKVRPDKLLCVYIYSKPLYAAEGSSSATSAAGLPPGGTAGLLLPRGSPCSATYCSVSHFNLIHASCHAAARSADASLRQPKREWDGATLRNGEVRCNNLLPVTSPGVSDTAAEAATSVWWDNLQLLSPCLQSSSLANIPAAREGTGKGPQPLMTRKLWTLMAEEGPFLRTIVVAGDLASLLLRFACKQSFSVDCGGGGKDSNASLVPCLIQHVLRLYGHVPASEREHVLTLVQHHVPGGADEGSGAATASGTGSSSSEARAVPSSWPMSLVLSLLTHSLGSWDAVLKSWVAYAVRQADGGSKVGAQLGSSSRSGDASSQGGTSGSSPAGLVLPPSQALRFLAILDWLQRRLKSSSSEAGGSSRGSGALGEEEWMASMRSRLEDLSQVSACAGELVAHLGRLDAVGDSVQELQGFIASAGKQ